MENDVLNNPIINCSNIANCDTKKLEEQLRNLHELFCGEPKHKGIIQVFPTEAGGGKSKQSERTLAYLYLRGEDTSSLIAKRFAIEGARTARAINDLAQETIACLLIAKKTLADNPEILEILKQDVDLFITDNKTNEQVYANIRNFRVLVITHKMFTVYSTNMMEKHRPNLTTFKGQQRRNLILDEEILFDKTEVNDNLINKIAKRVPDTQITHSLKESKIRC